MKIFTIGGTGLVGSRIVELLINKYAIDNLSKSEGVDITNPLSLDSLKKDTEHSIVILLAAKSDVDGCEKDKPLGIDGDAWKINVVGVQNVVKVCRDSNKKLIYISTDFVFNGDDTPENGYTEESAPGPINWYGQTKYAGEEIVKNSALPFIIARIAYPYRNDFPAKMDFTRAIRDRLVNTQPVAGVTDHKFCPTYIDDIANSLDKLIENNSTGIFHITGSQSLTPYDAAVMIAAKLGFPESVISKTTRAEYFAGRAPRPFNVSMNNDKIKQLGIRMKTFEEGLDAIK